MYLVKNGVFYRDQPLFSWVLCNRIVAMDTFAPVLLHVLSIFLRPLDDMLNTFHGKKGLYMCHSFGISKESGQWV